MAHAAPQLFTATPQYLTRVLPTLPSETLTLVGDGFMPGLTFATLTPGMPHVLTGVTAYGRGASVTIPGSELATLGIFLLAIETPPPGAGPGNSISVYVRSRADVNWSLPFAGSPDGIDIHDAQFARLISAGLATALPWCGANADGAGGTDSADALYILRIIAGLESAP